MEEGLGVRRKSGGSGIGKKSGGSGMGSKRSWNSRLPREEMCGGERIPGGGGCSLPVHRLQQKGDFFSCLKPVSTSCRLGTELNARFLNAVCGSI